MSSDSSNPVLTGPLLSDRKTWPAWYLAFKYQANLRNLWEVVDPYGEEAPNLMNEAPPEPTSMTTLIQNLNDERNLPTRQWLELPEELRTANTRPAAPAAATAADVEKEYTVLYKEWQVSNAVWSAKASRYQQLMNWVNATVKKDVLQPHLDSLVGAGNFTIQGIVVSLLRALAPTDASIEITLRQEYRAVLKQAENGRINPITWHANWFRAYSKGAAMGLSEVQGPLAVRDFLSSLLKVAPTWAGAQLQTVIMNDELGIANLTLEQYGISFYALANSEQAKAHSNGSPGIFATFGGAGSGGNANTNTKKSSTNQTTLHNCPCKEANAQPHKWEAIDCSILEYAITGATERNMRWKPDKNKIEQIKARLWWKAYSDLRTALQEKGWKLPANPSKGGGAASNSSKTHESGAGAQHANFPGNINACIIDPALMLQPGEGMYATLDFSAHPFSDSTLLDNCGAVHLVNSRDLLVQGSFRKSGASDYVEAGTQSIPIIGRGSRVIKNCLAGENGPNTQDLVLSNVAVVTGFHVNIVSEALLLKSGLWFSGIDCSLRWGELSNSIVMKQLERRANLVFFEYKHRSYSSVPLCIPSSSTTLMFPTLNRQINRAYRKTYDYAKPRTDTEEKWHARAGHLGPEALRALVWSARNVRIEGTARLKCEHCATTHTKQIISRRSSENRSPRPFWRIMWDLFDFPLGYDGSLWLLVIKDEYSGKLFGYPLKSKSLEEVHASIQHFDTWTKRQYGLAVCKIKHDNEKAVISINLLGSTTYQRWVEQEGIDLELTPSYTHEPNGGIEKAGQEVVDRSIKMINGAHLPPNLWPESSLAAIYLYNKSPSAKHQMRSPNEVLDLWFRQYFRWYDPALVKQLTVDLRPDWNGIYVYGARAYPMIKEREAGRAKRAFKTIPRGHIGYLVGYYASNIYRIWVPVLDQVIISRNVTFDEDILFIPEQEKEEGQPLSIIRDIAEAIELQENELQDAGGIIEGEWMENEESTAHDEQNNQNEAPAADLGGADSAELMTEVEATEDALLALEEQNSGVSKALDHRELGLLSPEATPVPESMPANRSREQNDLPERERTHVDVSDEITELLRNRSTFPQVVIQRSSPHDHKADDQTAAASSEPEASNTTAQSSRSAENPTSELQNVTRRRRKKDYGLATRSSSRNQGNKEDQERGAGSSGKAVFSTIIGARLESMMSKPGHQGLDMLEDFTRTFWPDQQSALEDPERHKTVHAVVAASLLPKRSRVKEELSIPLAHQSTLPKAPKSWDALTNHPLGQFFKKDAQLELSNLESRDCWRVIDVSQARTKPIPLKWVFTYKVDSSGFLMRCRSRIVVRGDLQDDDTILSTYAATLAARSFRVASALAAHFDLEIDQYDVVNAFVNAKRSSEGSPVVCLLPDGFKIPGKVCELDRALYGLRDSPALWYDDFSATLEKLELVGCKEEPCLFMNKQKKLLVLFYVDDVQVLYHKRDQKAADEFVAGLKRAYELREMGPVEWFLGVRIIRDRAAKKLWLVHDTYIEKIARKFNQADGKCPSTPLPAGELRKHEGQATRAQIKEYQEKVGSVLYTAIMLRPDVAFAAAQLSHYLTNPSPEHMSAVNWTIRYLFGTRFLAIQYDAEHREMQLLIASDASFADDDESRRSSQGYTMSLFGGMIAWRAARQTTVTTSTTEAELLGVGYVAKETMALKRFFKELCLHLDEPWNVFCDNTQTIRLIVGENMRISTKLRHVDIHNMWLRQEHAKGSFQVTYLPTNDMPADGLTKNLPRYKAEHFRALLNLQDVRGKIEKLE